MVKKQQVRTISRKDLAIAAIAALIINFLIVWLNSSVNVNQWLFDCGIYPPGCYIRRYQLFISQPYWWGPITIKDKIKLLFTFK